MKAKITCHEQARARVRDAVFKRAYTDPGVRGGSALYVGFLKTLRKREFCAWALDSVHEVGILFDCRLPNFGFEDGDDV